ncbi:MAG: O-antigen ligase family protein, partial [Acidobacteria bacterium]|nr:O-antigen ligase family protein [Acidobacteriota bacterium]
FYLPLLLYFFALLLSAAFSENRGQSFIKLFGEIYLLGLAVLSFNLVRTIKDAKNVIFLWIVATFIACLVSAISLALFYVNPANPLLSYTLFHYGTLPPGNYPRIASTFFNANMFCNYLNVSLMFVLAAYKLDWLNKTFLTVFLFFFSIAASLTLSPGLGGILLCFGAWLWLQFREKKQFIKARFSLFGGIFAAFLFFVALLFLPNENPLSPYHFNFFGTAIYPSERLLAWQASLQTLAENPFFGRGIGLDVVNIYSIIASGQKHFVGDSHQLWLSVAGQAGIFGLMAICFLCYFVYKKALPLKFDKNPQAILRVSFGLAFVGAFLYQGLGGSFEDARHLWVLIGLLASFGEESS